MALLAGRRLTQIRQLSQYGVKPGHADGHVELATLQLLQAGHHAGHRVVQGLPQVHLTRHAAVVATQQSVQLQQ